MAPGKKHRTRSSHAPSNSQDHESDAQFLRVEEPSTATISIPAIITDKPLDRHSTLLNPIILLKTQRHAPKLRFRDYCIAEDVTPIFIIQEARAGSRNTLKFKIQLQIGRARFVSPPSCLTKQAAFDEVVAIAVQMLCPVPPPPTTTDIAMDRIV
ncbi:hypothetical protein B7494_g8020 [Chlorociboria aeruginascens]|nr:hypothetical protein B7494_g8020 [Chlorociboria aeruginascens]